jgi:hypothetical protein
MEGADVGGPEGRLVAAGFHQLGVQSKEEG